MSVATSSSTSWRRSTEDAGAATGAGGGRRLVGAPADVRLEGLRKAYGDVVAVDGLTSRSRRGEFFTMLGPSGSGKTTTLRLIAGFERPDAGRVVLAGAGRHARAALRPRREHGLPGLRALPHMTVARERRLRPEDQAGRRKERAANASSEALEIVRLPGPRRRASRRSSRAASASASRSRGRS